MLNDAHQNSLRIEIGVIEEKMRAMDFRLAHPDERALTFEMRNDLFPDMMHSLRDKVAVVPCLTPTLSDRLNFPIAACNMAS